MVCTIDKLTFFEKRLKNNWDLIFPSITFGLSIAGEQETFDSLNDACASYQKYQRPPLENPLDLDVTKTTGISTRAVNDAGSCGANVVHLLEHL